MSEVTGPVVKRAKTTDTQTIENFIDRLVNSRKNLQAVISDEYCQPIPTVKVYVGKVKDVKDLSRVISILNEKTPLKELSHLKRAKRSRVILCPTQYFSEESIQEYLLNNISELAVTFEYFKIVDVPLQPPKTKKQHQEAIKTWACNFHPNNYLEGLISGNFFTQREIRDHRLYMGMAFEVAKWSLSRTNSNLELSDILLSDINATVVIDPVCASVVAIAFDNRQHHPIQHSVMLAIDNVAKTQNGGAWNMETECSSGIDQELLMHLSGLYTNTKFGAKKYIAKNSSETYTSSADCPYLCTGYYIYSIREPCVMCAMGLIHARAKRVFFCIKNSLQGAVYSKTKLQSVKSLNHHFEVFTEFIQVEDLVTCNIQLGESGHDILPKPITMD